MSARKNVNQSRPRALPRAAASRLAGSVCFDAADDAKPPPTRRSSRPPSNSSANADSSMSPAPSGIYGVGFWPSAPCNRPPLSLFSAAPHRVMPDKGRRSCFYQCQRVCKRGNFEKSPVSSMELGIMRRRDFEKNGIFRSSSSRWRYGTFYAGAVGRPWRSTLFTPPSTWSFIPTSRFVRSTRRRRSSAATPATISIARRGTAAPDQRRLTPEEADATGEAFRAKAFAPGPKRKACCWSRRMMTSTPKLRRDAPAASLG